MFQLTKSLEFDAAHQLRGYPGKCANLHGHTYKMIVGVTGEKLSEIGMLYDFFDLKRVMQEEVNRLDHRFINEIAPYDRINPTAENMAYTIYQAIKEKIKEQNPALRLSFVEIWETPTCSARYSEN